MTGGINIGGAWRLTWRLVLGLVLLVVALLLLFRVAAALRERSAAVPATSTLVATPLGRVAVALSGPVDGMPVMLIPGTAGWSGFWRDVSGHLAARGYRVIAVDLPPSAIPSATRSCATIGLRRPGASLPFCRVWRPIARRSSSRTASAQARRPSWRCARRHK